MSKEFRGIFAQAMTTVCLLVIFAVLVMYCQKYGGYGGDAETFSRDDHPEDW